MNEEFQYVGTELDLFEAAANWKQTLRRHIQPFLCGRILEVGAGIGGTTRVLRTGNEESWTCLEPDPSLVAKLQVKIPDVETVTGSLVDIAADRRFETIIYVDVLEHIEDDRTEVCNAAKRLNPGGHLIVLCPAHQWLFSPFDKSIGHFRRYSKTMFRTLCPDGLMEKRMIYLDSAGLFASLANKLLLSQSQPTQTQIAFWDTCLVPVSRFVDWGLRYSIGKSVLAVWHKPQTDERIH